MSEKSKFPMTAVAEALAKVVEEPADNTPSGATLSSNKL